MQSAATLSGAISDKRDGATILALMKGVYDRMRCQMITTAGLVITATTGLKVPKTGAAICYGIVKGAPFTIAAGVDMPALVGTVTNGKFNVFCFFAGAAGTSITATDMVSAMGTEATLLANVKFPPFPEGKTLIGYIIVNPAGTGNFVGDSTALNDGTVFSAGGTVYVSAVGANCDPSATY